MKRGMRKTAAACCIALLLLSGCGKTAGNVNSDTADSSAVTEQSGSEESAVSELTFPAVFPQPESSSNAMQQAAAVFLIPRFIYFSLFKFFHHFLY